ncbi:MAG: DUF4437 domain-containing protein [Bacteroidota bacterium]
MPFFNILLLSLFTLAIYSCSPGEQEEGLEQAGKILENPTKRLVLSSDIDWEQLNPARGDQSPQAGTVWGDRKGEVATGFLAKFVDGFSSPPHIHNVTYRAIVIKGLIHNDDPAAADMWMPSGSFWTQPVGEAHITSAKGEENIAYVEIDRGPYLVQPIEDAFDSGERPVNIDAINIIWLGADKTNWVSSDSEAEISFLWESSNQKGLRGLFVKLPAGHRGQLSSEGAIFHAIVIQGELDYQMAGETTTLDPSSYFGVEGAATHQLANEAEEAVIIYVRTNGKIGLS